MYGIKSGKEKTDKPIRCIKTVLNEKHVQAIICHTSTEAVCSFISQQILSRETAPAYPVTV